MSTEEVKHEHLMALLDRHTVKLHKMERFLDKMHEWVAEVDSRLEMLEKGGSFAAQVGGPPTVAGKVRCRMCGQTHNQGSVCPTCGAASRPA